MAEAAVMTEDATPKKVAFAQKPYSNEDKRKKEEEELQELLAEQKGEAKEPVEQEEEPTSKEEKTFKKRYGDLRRHTQQKESELQEQITALKSQLNDATRQEIHLPKSDEDIEAWAVRYPDVAAIVETIAIKKAREQSEHLAERVKQIDDMQLNVTREKAENELLNLHPDFNEIKETDEFHNWAEEQPKWIQSALYENENDARAAARAIDLYKADMGISKKRKATNKDAALATNTKNSRSVPQESESSDYLKESVVQKMSSTQYEKNQDAIMEAIRTGKFIYDVSGNAR
jgi:hypothetical protein